MTIATLGTIAEAQILDGIGLEGAIPKFKFVLDEGIAYSVHIADILSKLDINGENKPDAE